MFRPRLAAAATAVLLSMGGATSIAAADTADPSAPPLEAVATADGWSVTIPGVGVASFSVDDAGNISGLILAPASDAAAPTDGVHIAFTMDGGATVFTAELENEHGVLTIKLEDDVEDSDDEADEIDSEDEADDADEADEVDSEDSADEADEVDSPDSDDEADEVDSEDSEDEADEVDSPDSDDEADDDHSDSDSGSSD